ncbi:hypothetical protein T484DRAFT_1742560 [Baffinella frigidus]|nr:hypothetical protein T484DRAFT_1742560 [Cryptophyta sp. CCMP2293]
MLRAAVVALLALVCLVGRASAFLGAATTLRASVSGISALRMTCDTREERPGRGVVSRRGLLSTVPALALALRAPATAGAVEMFAPLQQGDIVVSGEMRLEVGSEKKMAKAGGKAIATVILRVVGKGIISTTTQEIDVKDFPVSDFFPRTLPVGRESAERFFQERSTASGIFPVFDCQPQTLESPALV